MLPAGVVDAWAAAVLELGKIPRGINRKEHSEEELLGHVMRQELPLISDIWSVFTQERGELSKALLSGRREAVAYLVGFHLANAARAQLTWMRATERYDLPQWLRSLATPLHWHDLGCGTGAVAQAMGDALLTAGLTPEKLDLHLYDATGTLLDAARTLFGHAGVRMQTHRVGLEALAVDRFLKTGEGGVSAYSLGYVWNELAKNPVARARLLKLFEAHAERQDRALVMILEPAMQNISRDAMTLRDQLVAAGYVPLYHCPAATPCPMLEKTRDWCYSEGDWQRPKAMYQLDRALGMDRSRLTGTFFLFASAALAPELKAFGKPMPVVVGRPLRVSGTAAFDYLLCTGADLKKQPPAPGKKCLARGLPLNA